MDASDGTDVVTGVANDAVALSESRETMNRARATDGGQNSSPPDADCPCEKDDLAQLLIAQLGTLRGWRSGRPLMGSWPGADGECECIVFAAGGAAADRAVAVQGGSRRRGLTEGVVAPAELSPSV